MLQRNRAPGWQTDTGESLEEFGLAVAGNTGDADDLARAKVEADAFDPGDAQTIADFEVAHGEERGAGLGEFFFDAEQHGAPDHFFCELPRRRGGSGHFADDDALPHDRHPIRDGHNLAQLVRDEDDGFPFVAETAQHFEERVSLLWRQDGGRFVENENLRAAVERLEDFHALLESDRQLGHDGVERNSERVVAGEFFEFGPGAGESPGEEASALDTEDDVFEHREILHEHEMLVNHADARADRVLRRTEIDAATMHANLAGVGPVKSVDDIH